MTKAAADARPKLSLQSVLRDFLIPPGFYRLARDLLGKSGVKINSARHRLPHSWKGETFGPVRGTMRLPIEKTESAVIVTRANESRASVPILSGETLAINDLPKGSTHLEFAVAAGDPRHPPSDAEIALDGKLVSRLIGPLAPECWHHVRLAIDPAQRQCKLTISYVGKALYLSDPVPLRPSHGTKPPNIVVLVLDSLKPEQLGCYRSTVTVATDSPVLDDFFSSGQRFENAYCQGEWTLTSLASMMTGLYPIQHGVYSPSKAQRELPLRVPTLAEVLARSGYRTFGYSTGQRFGPIYGHYRGFERFFFHNRGVEKTADSEMNAALEFVAANHDQPFFCFLHVIDPHPPFALPSYYGDLAAGSVRWGDPRALYNDFKLHRDSSAHVETLFQVAGSKLRETDYILGKFFSSLGQLGALQNTAFILLSDHGRDFFKRSPLLNADLTAGPFLIRGPGIEPGTARAFTETGVDLYPTVLRLAGLEVPQHAVGRNALDTSISVREFCKSESLYEDAYEIAIREPTWFYSLRCPMDPATDKIFLKKPVGEWLFRRDPITRQEDRSANLIKDEQGVAKRMRKRVEEHCQNLPRYFEDECIIEATRDYERMPRTLNIDV